MSAATRSVVPRRVSLPNRSFVAAAREILERAFSHLSRKPDALYDVRKGKAAPFPVRHIDDYRQAAAMGADKARLLDIHELVGLEAESVFADDPSRIGGRLHLTLDEAHEAEVAAECEANLAQLVAVRTRQTPDLERALTATLREMTTLKQYARTLRRELDARTSLDRHVGTRPAS